MASSAKIKSINSSGIGDNSFIITLEININGKVFEKQLHAQKFANEVVEDMKIRIKSDIVKFVNAEVAKFNVMDDFSDILNRELMQ